MWARLHAQVPIRLTCGGPAGRAVQEASNHADLWSGGADPSSAQLAPGVCIVLICSCQPCCACLRAGLLATVLPRDTRHCAEGCQEVWYQCCASLKGICTPSASNTGYDTFM